MPSAETLLTFLIALFFLEVTPGPDMMLILGRGIGQGRKTALLTVAGVIFLAGSIKIALLVLGVASLLQAYPEALTMLRWAGAGYLLWLGYKLIRASLHRGALAVAVAEASCWSALRKGAINSLTNPKSLLFMFAFLPQFVDPAVGPVWVQLMLLGSLQMLSGIVALSGVAMASGTVGQWLARWPRLLAWQQRFTGSVMVGLGLRLILSGNTSPSPTLRA
jgi:threonine/homoserine/homoserine lactone efflux protein